MIKRHLGKNTLINRQGFSLVEMIVAIAIMTIISASLLKVFVISAQVQKSAYDMDMGSAKATEIIELYKKNQSTTGIHLAIPGGTEIVPGSSYEWRYDFKWQTTVDPSQVKYVMKLTLTPPAVVVNAPDIITRFAVSENITTGRTIMLKNHLTDTSKMVVEVSGSTPVVINRSDYTLMVPVRVLYNGAINGIQNIIYNEVLDRSLKVYQVKTQTSGDYGTPAISSEGGGVIVTNTIQEQTKTSGLYQITVQMEDAAGNIISTSQFDGAHYGGNQ